MKKQQVNIYTTLKNDTTLATLLGATGSNNKIFPIIPDNFEDFPCLTYSIVDSNFRTTPKNTQDITIEFRVFGSNKTVCEDIFERVNTLMNYLQDWNKSIIYVKQSAELDLPEEDRSLWSKVIRYSVWASN